MTDTTTADDPTPDTNTTFRVLVWTFRFVQVTLVGLAAILLIGATQMSVVALAVIALLAGVMVMFALAVEFIAVRPCQRRL
jgi:hypothetical protein